MTSLDAATALKSAVCIKTYILSQIFPHHLHNITSPTYSSLIQHFHLGAVTWRTRVLLQRCARRTASFSAETEARGGGPWKVKAPVAVATARMERTDISEVSLRNFFFGGREQISWSQYPQSTKVQDLKKKNLLLAQISKSVSEARSSSNGKECTTPILDLRACFFVSVHVDADTLKEISIKFID